MTMMRTIIMTPFMMFAIVAISCVVLSTTSSISSVTGFSTVITRLPALQLRHNNNKNNQPGYNQHETVGDGDRTRTMTVSLQAGIFDFLKGDNNDDNNDVDTDKNTSSNKNKKSTAATKKSSAKNKPVKAKVKAKSLFDKSQQSENSKSYTGIKRS